MPRAKASHYLRRISQGEPRAPLSRRHSECGEGLRCTPPLIVASVAAVFLFLGFPGSVSADWHDDMLFAAIRRASPPSSRPDV